MLLAALAAPALAAVIGPGHAGSGKVTMTPTPDRPPVRITGQPPPAGPQAIRLSVTPKRAVAGRTTRFRFRVTTTFKAPFRNARVTLGGKHATSGIYGDATIRVKLKSAKRYTARAVQAGATTTAIAKVKAARAKKKARR